MTIHRLQQLPTGPVLRQRVRSWPQAVQVVLALVVCLELAAQVVVALVVRVLEVVLAVAAGLPHVEGDVGNWLLRHEILDDAVHVSHDAALGLVLDDAVAEFAPGSIGRPEGTEDGGGGGDVAGVFGLDVIGDFGHQAVTIC